MCSSDLVNARVLGSVTRQSVEERAWGFSEEEYARALAKVFPEDISGRRARDVFEDLRINPDNSVGGDDFIFALLSLVSDSCRERVIAITKWSPSELARQQAIALRVPPTDMQL